MTTQNSKPRAILFTIAALALLALAGYFYATKIHVEPLTTFRGVQLGMSESDVTVVFGRKSDCAPLEVPGQKTLFFRTLNRPCGTSVVLSNQGGTLRATLICSSEGLPVGAPLIITEAQALEAWGEPSSISINRGATRKIANYARRNFAVEYEAGDAILQCVTSSPVGYGSTAASS